jgi:hypothetical protein
MFLQRSTFNRIPPEKVGIELDCPITQPPSFVKEWEPVNAVKYRLVGRRSGRLEMMENGIL